ncbi:MAG: hypothetical protein J7L34_04390 [Thermotogaceae bacterium]|nr:hypothetical protein [Thermotogaceae bacterium]
MINLFKGTFLRSVTEIKRYFLNWMSSMISMFIIYFLIIFGFKTFGGPSMGNTVQAAALGYFTWLLMLTTMGDLSWTIMNEINRGMIEQEFLSPYGPLAVFIFYELSNLLMTFPILFFMMIVMFSFAGISITLPVSFYIIMLLAMLQSMGMGFILGGITLMYKRTNALLQLMQFAVIGFLFISAHGWKAIFVPIAPHFALMKDILAGKSLDGVYFMYTILGTILWLLIGFTVFRFFERKVRISGNLSLY